MQLRDSILDGALEVGEAMLDPSFVGLPDIESLGGVLVLGVGVMFIGATRTIEPAFGKAVSVTVGLILTLALFASPRAVPLVGSAFLFMSAALKLASGAALGALMARSAVFAVTAALSMGGVAWGVAELLPQLDLDGLEALKLAIVVASGIGTHDYLRRNPAFDRYPDGTVLGISICVAAVGLVNSDALMTADPGLAVPAQVAQVTFGGGVVLGAGARLLRRRPSTGPRL